jgi:hypothetical protein
MWRRRRRWWSGCRDRWLSSEQDRIAQLKQLLDGHLPSIEHFVCQGIEHLDFPFEAECHVAIDDEDHVLVDVDLPEIEDVVPEFRYSVLKNGNIKETKRKIAERNDAYAHLVTGIAFTVAATAFAMGPSVQKVTIAGRTQRKERESFDAVDIYVYEVKFSRTVFDSIEPLNLDPVQAMQRLPSRISYSASGSLKKVAAPDWVEAVHK